MATRKSRDGSRGMSGSSDRPGSYAKSNGSRRKRKGKKSGRATLPPESSMPPGMGIESSEQAIEDALDIEGEEVERHPRARITQPELSPVNDNAIDDLRTRPSSDRAIRTPVGPLGMHDAKVSSPQRASTPRPVGATQRLNVVEINAPSQRPQDDDRDRYESSGDPFGEPFEHDVPSSSPPPSNESQRPRASMRPSASAQLALQDVWRASEPPGRPSMSSVFDARTSMSPSSRPPHASSTSLIGWFLVAAMSTIIVAAGVIAWREHETKPVAREARPVQPPAEPTNEAKVEAAPSSAKTPTEPVRTDATPAPKAVVAAPVTTPTPTPTPTRTVAPTPAPTAATKPMPTVAAKPALRPTVAPATTKPKPVATPAPGTVEHAADWREAPLAKPADWNEALFPERPAPEVAPRARPASPNLEAPTPSSAQTKIPASADEPARVPEERLPQNPYR